MGWFRTPKQKFAAAFMLVMSCVFAVLTFLSTGAGEQAFSRPFAEREFESEAVDTKRAATFTVDSRTQCMVEVKSSTLDQSWIWAKVLILDEEGRPVHDFKFNLSYYHGYEGGESWSEGDRDDYAVFVVPKGTYSVVVYGEDEASPGTQSAFGRQGYSTINRDERLTVTIYKDVLLTRYFMMLLILFGGSLIVYSWWRSEKAKTEQPTSYDYAVDDWQQYQQDEDAYTQGPSGPTGGSGQSSYSSSQTNPDDPFGPVDDGDNGANTYNITPDDDDSKPS